MDIQTIYKQIFFTMKEFLKKNFTIIVLVIAVLSFFKSCGDSRSLSKMSKQMETLVTKEELAKELKREGLKSEKRMIQSTDRKMLDVSRQTQIDEELKKLDSE
jgi:signal transduction histidine kinase